MELYKTKSSVINRLLSNQNSKRKLSTALDTTNLELTLKPQKKVKIQDTLSNQTHSSIEEYRLDEDCQKKTSERKNVIPSKPLRGFNLNYPNDDNLLLKRRSSESTYDCILDNRKETACDTEIEIVSDTDFIMNACPKLMKDQSNSKSQKTTAPKEETESDHFSDFAKKVIFLFK